MAKAFELLDFDEMYYGLGFNPIMLNDISTNTTEEREYLNEIIMTTYDDDMLETIPTCSPHCKETSYGHNLGEVCPSCGCRVEMSSNTTIEPTVWFRSPDELPSLINPHLWLVLSPIMRRGNFNILRWFCNPYAPDPLPVNKTAWLDIRKLQNTGIERGLSNFVTHFNTLIPTLVLMQNKKAERPDLEMYLRTMQHRFFPKHLFIPNRISLVMENTNTGTYIDTTITSAVDAARSVCSLTGKVVSVKRLESRFTMAIDSLSQYYFDVLRKHFSKKEGWLRHVMLGARMPFSFRTVITSQTGVHEYDTLKIPYTEFVIMYKLHLMSKLRQRGYSKRDAWDYVDKHTIRRDSLIDALIVELIAETPNGEGAWCLHIRYPTLDKTSIQAFRIIGVTDSSTVLSPLAIVGANTDFDGDILSGLVAASRKQAADFKMYQPHYGIFALNKPRTFTGHLGLPSVTIGVYAEWFEEEEDILGEAVNQLEKYP